MRTLLIPTIAGWFTGALVRFVLQTRPNARASLLLFLMLSSGCAATSPTGPEDPATSPAPGPQPPPPPPPPPPPSSGVVSGLVTDTQGRPIAGAKVVINNATWYNRNVVLTSGADGRYRFTLPPSDAWYVRGTTIVTYHGRQYEVELKPDFSASFSGTEGRVVNLQWVMTGVVSKDFGAGGYYGGTVRMDTDLGMSDLDGVVLTLTPDGPLLDGSTGHVITHKVVGARGFIELPDVPMGRYTVRATLNNAPLNVRMRRTSSEATTQTAIFEPEYPGATIYGLYFYVSIPQ